MPAQRKRQRSSQSQVRRSLGKGRQRPGYSSNVSGLHGPLGYENDAAVVHVLVGERRQQSRNRVDITGDEHPTVRIGRGQYCSIRLMAECAIAPCVEHLSVNSP